MANVESRQSRAINVTAELDVDFSKEKMEVFRQAWTYMRDGFYDEKFHGADWGEVRATFTPIVAGVRTSDELRRVLNLMMGELNASHLGASGGGGGGQASNNGRLGLLFDRAEYESSGRLKVTSVLPLGPAAITKQAQPGEYLLAVDGVNVGETTNLDEQLMHKVGRRVELRMSATPDGAGARTVMVQPIRAAPSGRCSTATGSNRIARTWTESATASWATCTFATCPRGAAPARARPRRGQPGQSRCGGGRPSQQRRICERVCHRRARAPRLPHDDAARPARIAGTHLARPALARAADDSRDESAFPLGCRGLHGRLSPAQTRQGRRRAHVGMDHLHGQRHAHRRHVDSHARTRITSNDGQTMELNPRMVDIPVTRPMGETYTGKDSQLEAAVRELLRQIGG